MRTTISRHKQAGAVIITTALVLLFLLGFMAFALDFGKLFVVKSELQTAMDSCALAAAAELDTNAGARARARNAGALAGNNNRVVFQSPTWSGQGNINQNLDISFRNAAYLEATSDADARYAICQHTQPAVQMWLMRSMAAFSGDTATYPAQQNVWALAVASRASSQTTCPVPVGLRPKPGSTGPNWGFAPGEWVRVLMQQGAVPGGEIGWMNLDGSSSAAETEREMNGYCNVRVGQQLGTPGVQSSIADAWNSRFGIYKNNSGPDQLNRTPDFTGYSYTQTNWPTRQNAYADFVQKRAAFAACAPSGRVRGGNSCESITGLSLNSFQNLATAGPGGQHQLYGSNRRVVPVPVVNGSTLVDYACMLMLQPMTIPMSNIYMEFLGNAAQPNSPCTTSGIPGGSAGPQVPVLVR